MSKIFNVNTTFKIREGAKKKDYITLYGIFAPVTDADKERLKKIRQIKKDAGLKVDESENLDSDKKMTQLIYVASNKDEIERFYLVNTINANPGHYISWCNLHGFDTDEKMGSDEALDAYAFANKEYLGIGLDELYLAPMQIPYGLVAAGVRSLYGCMPGSIAGLEPNDTLKREERIYNRNIDYVLYEVMHAYDMGQLVELKKAIDLNYEDTSQQEEDN